MAPNTNLSRNPLPYPPSPVGPLNRICCFPIPRIQVKVDFRNASKRKPMAMDYTWGRTWGHLDETVRNSHVPSCLIPGVDNQRAQSSPYYQDQQPYNNRQFQYQQNHRITRPRSASELTERTRSSIISPVSPVSPISTEFSTSGSYQPTPQRRPQRPGVVPPQSREPPRIPQQQPRGVIWSIPTPNRGAPSQWSPQQTRSNSWSPQRFSPLSPYDTRNKPLPPLPSMGYTDRQDDSPWSFESPPWASPVQQRPRQHSRPQRPQNQATASTWTDPEILVLPPSTRLEDPQRIHNLSQLQEAMMTVDSLNTDIFADEMSRLAEEPHRGPRGVGWAVTRNDFNTVGDLERPPPPYAYGAVGQWDGEVWEEFGLRRCSSAY